MTPESAPFYAEVGIRIAAHRVGAAMTQDDLAAKVDLTRASIANAEAGRQALPLHTLARIAEITGARLESLLPGAPLEGRALKVKQAADALTEAKAEVERAKQRLADELAATAGSGTEGEA